MYQYSKILRADRASNPLIEIDTNALRLSEAPSYAEP